MNKLILIMILSMFSRSVMAEWSKVGSGEKQTSYIDKDSIRKNGYSVKMWRLFDFYTPQSTDAGAVLSLKELDEFDCNKNQWRMLKSSVFSGSMGKGSLISGNVNHSEWRIVAPASLSKIQWDIACKNGN